MGIDEIAIDCVHKIWWRTFAGSRRNSGYFRHVATLTGEVMKESKEKKGDSWSGQQESYDPGFIRVRVPIILSCHPNSSTLGPPYLTRNYPAISAALAYKADKYS
jgi:hypothetical protein